LKNLSRNKMKNHKTKFLLFLFVLVFSVFDSSAQQTKLLNGVFGNGGGVISSAHYMLNGTIGQTMIGSHTNGTIDGEIGFWNPKVEPPTSIAYYTAKPGINDQSIFEAFPNPFKTSINLKLNLESQQWVSIKIFNSSGIEIETIAEDILPEHLHIFNFKSGNLPNGIYYCRLMTNNFSVTKKISLIR